MYERSETTTHQEAEALRPGNRQVALTALGVGLLLGYTQALELGLDGILGLGAGQLAVPCAIARAIATAAVLAWYAILGHLRHYTIRKTTIVGAALLMTFSTALYAPVAGTSGEVAMAAFSGFGSGFILLIWALVLSSMPRGPQLAAVCGGILVGVAVTAVARVAQGDAALALLSLVSLVSPLAILAVDPKLDSCGPDDPLAPAVPPEWGAAALFVGCGAASGLLYGALGAPSIPNIPAPGVFIAAVVLVGAGVLALVWFEQGTPRCAWLAPLALVFVCVALVGTAGYTVAGPVLALVSAGYLVFPFVRWAVLPRFVGMGGKSRLFTCAVLMLVSTTGLWVVAGRSLAVALAPLIGPARLPLAVANYVALALVALMAILLAARLLARPESLAPSTAAEPAQDNIAVAAGDAQAPAPNDAAAVATGYSYQDRFASFAAKHGLTAREQEIALLTARGYSSTRIAEMLIISSSTVRFHQQNLYRKLDVHSRQDYIDLVASYMETLS